MPTRRTTAKQLRHDAAEIAHLRPHTGHVSNADESAHRSSNNQLSYIANFTKGVEHDPSRFDEVKPGRYRQFLRALAASTPEAFESLDVSPVPSTDRRNFVNPQAGLAFDLQGPDPDALALVPAPRLDSAEMAAEMAELYWMALLRDVNFIDFGTGSFRLSAPGPVHTSPPITVAKPLSSVNLAPR